MPAEVKVHPDVETALRDGRPVVALETAVLTHGLPRAPFAALPPGTPETWNASGPMHLETVRAMMAVVRLGGAVPAMIGVLEGALVIGLDDAMLEALASDEQADKAATSTLAATMAAGRSAGTTVSATLYACRQAGIRVLATGGIGGVHRGWAQRPDVSADLRELAESPVCVVCAGAKSILDLPATCEALETLGVPIVGFETDCMPRFMARGTPAIRVSIRLDDVAAVAALASARWTTLGQSGAVLLVTEVPRASAVDANELETAIARAETEAESTGKLGAARTPFLLDAVAAATGGRSLTANVALLLRNAALATRVAVALGP